MASVYRFNIPKILHFPKHCSGFEGEIRIDQGVFLSRFLARALSGGGLLVVFSYPQLIRPHDQ